MSAVQHVVVVGAGAMGAIYARHFATAPNISVSFSALGERANKLRDEGLCINGEMLKLPVFDALDTATRTRYEPRADLVVVAVKHQQLDAALEAVAPLVGPHTQFLSVLNGLDSEQTIKARFKLSPVLYCIALGMDAVRDGNRVRYASAGRLDFGEASNATTSSAVARVQQALAAANLAYTTPPSMLRTMWFKFMINVGVNQASAAMNAPYSVFKRDADARMLMDALMHEVIALSEPAGVNLGVDDLHRWHAVLAGLADDGETSMLQDVRAGRNTEVEIFAGKVLTLAQQYGIDTPYNRAMLSTLRVLTRTT